MLNDEKGSVAVERKPSCEIVFSEKVALLQKKQLWKVRSFEKVDALKCSSRGNAGNDALILLFQKNLLISKSSSSERILLLKKCCSKEIATPKK